MKMLASDSSTSHADALVDDVCLSANMNVAVGTTIPIVYRRRTAGAARMTELTVADDLPDDVAVIDGEAALVWSLLGSAIRDLF